MSYLNGETVKETERNSLPLGYYFKVKISYLMPLFTIFELILFKIVTFLVCLPMTALCCRFFDKIKNDVSD